MVLSEGSEPSQRKEFRGLSRTVVLLQSLVVASLSFVIGKEYENNLYLRQYLQNNAWSYLPVYAFLGTLVVGVGVSEAYVKLKGENGVSGQPLKPETLLSSAQKPGVGFGLGVRPSVSVSSPVLAEVPALSRGKGLLDQDLPGLDLTSIFSDWRPAGELKHVEPVQSSFDGSLAPKPYPVIRRLQPAREPVQVGLTRLTPPVLKRIGAPQSFDVQLPPILRSLDAVRDAVRKPQAASGPSEWGRGESAGGTGDVAPGGASSLERNREAREKKSGRTRTGGKRPETGKNSEVRSSSQA